MRCPYCGGETSNELNFCSKCGRSIEGEKPKQKQHNSPLISILILGLCVLIGFGITFITRIDGKNRQRREVTMAEDSVNSDAEQTDTSDLADEPQESQEPAENNKLYSIVEDPQYESLYVQKYGLTLEYPTHYIKSDGNDEYSVLLLKDPNGAAFLQFFACDIQIPIRQFADVITEEYGEDAKLLDETYTENTFYKKYRIGNANVILSGRSNDKFICFYNFSFAQFEEHIYQKYYEHIDSHFKLDSFVQ